MIGVLVIVLLVVQLVVIVAALYGFNQGWNIEEERPIGNGEDYGAGSSAAPPRSPPERSLPRCRRWDSNPQARKGNRF